MKSLDKHYLPFQGAPTCRHDQLVNITVTTVDEGSGGTEPLPKLLQGMWGYLVGFLIDYECTDDAHD